MSEASGQIDGGATADFGGTYWWHGERINDAGVILAASQIDSADYRAIVDNLPTLCWIANADGYITWYNRRWHEYCGTTPAQMEGWGWQSVHDPAVLPQVMESWTASIASGEPFEMVFPLRGADGVFRPFLTRIIPVRDTAGTVCRWVGNNIDITRQILAQNDLRQAQQDLQAANASLAERQGFLSSVLSASTDCIKVLELDGTLSFMSEGGMEVMEIGDFNAVRGCPWPDLMKDGGVGLAKDAIDAAREGRSTVFEAAADTYAGRPKWWSISVSPIRGHDGRVERILSVSRDITALHEARERQDLLNGELAHRLKNTLSVIQAIANQTLGSAVNRDALASFGSRLVALSGAHDVLTKQSWAAASIADVAGGVLGSFDDGARILLSGPDVAIGARATLSLSLLLHELATNAVKYGALSVTDGSVELLWTIEHEGGEKILSLSWCERGGPPAKAPSRRGFGSRIIRMGLTGAGGTDIKYEDKGLSFHAVAPLDQLQQS
ncbi:PAS domain S-box-containing protein [Sphingomonas jejuensis]|uniref:histidine kinase n=1 Tax=Sphingomonas jejuensis TaxID=904715 RepID=A0ABX0XI55_9SPHN|nr:PAS domain-containing protein [Sphingomonas jejuensis]NJC32843.1 PAS domain S-box-containing protein [Sphingomonas jejuensis]